jgi:subtilisin family serine protease
MLALAAPPPDNPLLARIDPELRLANEPQVQVVVEGNISRFQAENAGFLVEEEAEGLLQLRLAPSELVGLAALPGVERIRKPWRPNPKNTVTEGYAEVMRQDWHDEKLSGKGVRIGVLDVGFVGWDTLPPEERPAKVSTDFSRGEPDLSDHGTAVVEVIHDFAPDAELVLATFGSDVEFCAAAEFLKESKVDLINASVGFDNLWPADGSSSVSRCVDKVVDAGVSWFAAAGNENRRYRIGELSYNDDGFVAIGGISDLQIPTTLGNFAVVFRWTEPMGEAEQDLDLQAFNEDGSLCGSSSRSQSGHGSHPLEEITVFGCGEQVQLRIVSEGQVADLKDLRGFLYSPLGLPSTLRTAGEDLTLPGDAEGAITVGAYDGASDSIFDYSSQGPTEDGRAKPDVVAPSAVTTVTYGFAGFEGSSAATPHAAGLGALWMDATGKRRKPEEMKQWMMEGARDLGEEGPDFVFGAGAILGDEPPPCGCTAAGSAPLSLGLMGLLLARRRRS